jgi:sulfide dehydrogenase cytochrome subunit
MPNSLAMKPRAAALLFCASAVVAWAQPSPLPAPTFAPPNLSPAGVESLASGCAICHGPSGKPAPGSQLDALAGRNAREIVEAMIAFKTGQRPATVMHQISKGYSDAEIEAMARWFASRGRSR